MINQSRKTMQLAAAVVVIVAAVTLAFGWIDHTLGMAVGLALSTGLIIAMGYHWKQHFVGSVGGLYAEAHELNSRMTLLAIPIKGPLPWSTATLRAITICQVLFEIRSRRSTHVVECGSGVSTIYIAWMLRHLGAGKVYAIEHEDRWADLVQAILNENELEDYVQIVRAPLKEDTFGSHRGIWYDRDALASIFSLESIDLLLVDGPQQKLGPSVRYPALPAFWQQITGHSVIVLDDTRPNNTGSQTNFGTQNIPAM